MAKDEAFRSADKKIEIALRTGGKEVDLSTCYKDETPRFTELPGSWIRSPEMDSIR